MKVEIPQAHGEALAERKQILQQIDQQYQIIAGEDRRHAMAVLKSLGHPPDDYGQYQTLKEGDHYFLELQPKQQQPQMVMPPPAEGQQQQVNGSVQPQ